MNLPFKGSCSARRGSALALALLVVTLVAGMGFAFLTLASAVTKRQAADVETVQAFYLAESGLAEAFHAVRSGRSGQIGTAAEPATFGGGLIWVEAFENNEGLVELDAQAMFGRARAALRMTVEPVPLELGFFADHDLVIDSVLLLDGFEGSSQTYVPPVEEGPAGIVATVPTPRPSHDYDRGATEQLMDNLVMTLTLPLVERLLSADDGLTFTPDPTFPDQRGLAHYDDLGGSAAEPYLADLIAPIFDEGQLENLRHTFPEMYLESFQGFEYELDEDRISVGGTGPTVGGLPLPPVFFQKQGTPSSTNTPAEAVDTETSSGLMGSNGNISFQLSSDESAVLFGDVVPGPNGVVNGLSDSVRVTGSTRPRPSAVDLPPVEVPAIQLQPGVVHSSILPMTVPPGASGFASLTVEADAELVLRGPATIVIGELNLADGALLTLDTRNGAVDLYVTDSMHLEPGSDVSTTAEQASDATIQVSAAQASGDPLVQLEATSRFTGTIYSPQADVYVGSEFEVFGGIVARKLELAPGARLHAEQGDRENTPLPELVSWKLLVVPTAPALAHSDPFRLYGMTRETAVELGEAHDLDAVSLELDYVDLAGVEQRFEGVEADFDWDGVSEVIEVRRTVDYAQLKQASEAARIALDVDARREEPALLQPIEGLDVPQVSGPSIRQGVQLIGLGSLVLSKGQLIQALNATYVPITPDEAGWLDGLGIGFNQDELDQLMNL